MSDVPTWFTSFYEFQIRLYNSKAYRFVVQDLFYACQVE